MSGIGWTEERVDRLKALWAEGLSASQVAADLGGVTRNAVIGKVHRLGLSGRAGKPSKRVSAPRTPTSKTSAPSEPKTDLATVPRSRGNLALALAPVCSEPAPTEAVQIIPAARYLTINELDAFTCRWPIGDPMSPDFRFCGAPTTSDQPYCTACSKKAYLVVSRPSRAGNQQKRFEVPLRRFG